MSPLMQRVVAAFGAHSYGQAINILTQLASLPLFLTAWDPATYGVWLILTAMPTYLNMSDGGLVTAAANEIAISFAQNQLDRANALFQSTFAFLLTTCAIVWCVAWVAIFGIGLPGVATTDRQFALILLATGVLMAQFNGLAETIFRAAGKHAVGIFLGNTSRLLEWCGWIIGLFIFRTFWGVAAVGLAFRTAGFLVTCLMSVRLNSGIHWRLQHASKTQVKQLIGPAASFMSFTLSNALSIQGVTLMVGHLLGPVAVTVFNTYRTISRVALLITGTLGNALWAEFARLYATGGMNAVKPLFQRSFRIGMLTSIGLSLALIFVSPYLLKYWSRNHISFELPLMVLMLTYAAIGGTWNVARILLMSINNHKNLAKIAIFASIATLILCLPLGSQFQLNGIAAGLVVIEAAMAWICISAARVEMKTTSKP